MTNKNNIYSADLASMLYDASIDRVMALDADWNIIAWNKTSENVTGLSKIDLLGKNVMEIFPRLKEDEEILTAIRSALNGKTSFLPSRPSLFNRDYYENHFMYLQ